MGGSPAVTADEEVQLAVVVVVGHGHAHSPAQTGQTSFLGYILKGGVGLLMVQSDHGVTAGAVAIHSRAIHYHQVGAPVVVAIKDADTATHRFQDVALFAGGNVHRLDAHLRRDILENRDGRETTVILLLRRSLYGR